MLFGCYTELHMLEAMLIAQAHPVVRVCHRGGPTGQLWYKMNVITFPKENYNRNMHLPWSPAELPLYIVHKQINETRHQHFMVRKYALLSWLTWLKENNPLYHNISINHDVLNQLSDTPEGDIPENLQTLENIELLHSLNNAIDQDRIQEATHSNHRLFY